MSFEFLEQRINVPDDHRIVEIWADPWKKTLCVAVEGPGMPVKREGEQMQRIVLAFSTSAPEDLMWFPQDVRQAKEMRKLRPRKRAMTTYPFMDKELPDGNAEEGNN